MLGAVAERCGHEVRWDPAGGPTPPDDGGLSAALGLGLPREEAIQVAIARDPTLRAEFEELGIARAELLRAGSARNPIVSAALMASTAGEPGLRLEGSVVGDLLDLLRIPARRRAAALDLDATVQRTADRVLALAHDVEVAYLDLQAAEQAVRARLEGREALEAAAELARRQAEAGNVTDLDVAREEIAALEAGVAVRRAEAEVEARRADLARHLALRAGEGPIPPLPPLPELPPPAPEESDPTAAALSRRLDLAAARQAAEALRVRLGIAATAVPDGFPLGIAAERDPDGATTVGPSVEVEIPIFDTGRAERERALAQWRQALARVAALEADVRREVRAARERVAAARDVAVSLRDDVLPRRRAMTALTLRLVEAMQAGPFDLLLAKQAETVATAEAVQALRDYWVARADLDRALGGRRPETGGGS